MDSHMVQMDKASIHRHLDINNRTTPSLRWHQEVAVTAQINGVIPRIRAPRTALSTETHTS